jgi:tetratricopeptide (TPR) repeat protein
VICFSSILLGEHRIIYSLDEHSLREIDEISLKIEVFKNVREKIKNLENLIEKSINYEQYDLALHIYNELLKLKSIPKNKRFEYYVGLGDVYSLKQDYISSISYYKEALLLYPKNIEIRFKIGSMFLKSSLYDFAETAFLEILKIDGNSSIAKKRLGDIFCCQGMYTKAIEYYSQIDFKNCDKDSILRIVECYKKLNEIDDAIELLKSVTVHNQDPELLFLQAVLYIDKEEYSKAENLLLQLIKKNDTRNFKTYVYLALLYDLMGETLKAKKMFDEVYKINPSYAVIDFLRAKIAYKMGNFHKARKYANDAHFKATTVFVKDQTRKMIDFLRNK